MRLKIISSTFAVAAAALVLTGCDDADDASAASEVPVSPVAEAPSPHELDFMNFVGNHGDRVFFQLNSSSVLPQAKEALAKQADWLKRNPSIAVVVEGHCDERGTAEFNMALGNRRAEAAKKELVKLGVSADRIRVISYGKEKPAVVGSNEQAWSLNRRAVTVIAQ